MEELSGALELGKPFAKDFKDEGLSAVYVECLHPAGEKQEVGELGEVLLLHHLPEDFLVFDDLRDGPKEIFVALYI